MADNVPITPGSGVDVATDDTSVGQVQFVKLMDGTLDSTQRIGGDATNGLDVDVTRLPALPAGTNNIGKVSVIGDQPATTAGTITTAASTVVAAVTGYGNATITISGTYAGVNVTFEVSDDGGTTYFPVQVQRESDGIPLSVSGVLTANASVMYLLSLAGVTHVRVRATAWTSGTANVRISPGSMPFEPVVSVGNPLPAGTNNIGDVDVLTLPALPAGTNNIGDVDVLTMPTVTTKPAGTTGATTSVASTVTANTTLIAADANRFALTIYNESTATLFVLMGAGTESATVYTVQVPPGAYFEVPEGMRTLRASGHWSAANGSARITAVT
jgi:hypothetical protein